MNESIVTAGQVISAYAASLRTYYQAECDFVDNPNTDTLGVYHRAFDRLVTLRNETIRSGRVGDALYGPPLDESPARDLAAKIHDYDVGRESGPGGDPDPQEGLDEGYPKPPPDYPPPPEVPDEPAA